MLFCFYSFISLYKKIFISLEYSKRLNCQFLRICKTYDFIWKCGKLFRYRKQDSSKGSEKEREREREGEREKKNWQKTAETQLVSGIATAGVFRAKNAVRTCIYIYVLLCIYMCIWLTCVYSTNHPLVESRIEIGSQKTYLEEKQ